MFSLSSSSFRRKTAAHKRHGVSECRAPSRRPYRGSVALHTSLHKLAAKVFSTQSFLTPQGFASSLFFSAAAVVDVRVLTPKEFLPTKAWRQRMLVMKGLTRFCNTSGVMRDQPIVDQYWRSSLKTDEKLIEMLTVWKLCSVHYAGTFSRLNNLQWTFDHSFDHPCCAVTFPWRSES